MIPMTRRRGMAMPKKGEPCEFLITAANGPQNISIFPVYEPFEDEGPIGELKKFMGYEIKCFVGPDAKIYVR